MDYLQEAKAAVQLAVKTGENFELVAIANALIAATEQLKRIADVLESEEFHYHLTMK